MQEKKDVFSRVDNKKALLSSNIAKADFHTRMDENMKEKT